MGTGVFIGEQWKDMKTNAAVFQKAEESSIAEDIVEPQRMLQQKENPSAKGDIKVQMSCKGN